jgi:hypothetical protein
MGCIKYYKSKRVKNVGHRNLNLNEDVMASADCLMSRKNLALE